MPLHEWAVTRQVPRGCKKCIASAMIYCSTLQRAWRVGCRSAQAAEGCTNAQQAEPGGSQGRFEVAHLTALLLLLLLQTRTQHSFWWKWSGGDPSCTAQ